MSHGVFQQLNRDYLTISRWSHWDFMTELEKELFGCEVDKHDVPLKKYQDLIVALFIKRHLPPGAKILEIGGGVSRILEHFRNEHECWCIDKMEGLGNGPVDNTKEYSWRLVRDFIGNFSHALPGDYFDLVFSISVLEHVPETSSETFDNILKDIQRVMSPGAFSFHCIDIVLKVNEYWTNQLVPYIFNTVDTINSLPAYSQFKDDDDIFVMSESAYQKYWERYCKKSYQLFGRPASLNVLWKKEIV